jgi:hypothetical protein
MMALYYPFEISSTLAAALERLARGDGTGFDALPWTLSIQYDVSPHPDARLPGF